MQPKPSPKLSLNTLVTKPSNLEEIYSGFKHDLTPEFYNNDYYRRDTEYKLNIISTATLQLAFLLELINQINFIDYSCEKTPFILSAAELKNYFLTIVTPKITKEAEHQIPEEDVRYTYDDGARSYPLKKISKRDIKIQIQLQSQPNGNKSQTEYWQELFDAYKKRRNKLLAIDPNVEPAADEKQAEPNHNLAECKFTLAWASQNTNIIARWFTCSNAYETYVTIIKSILKKKPREKEFGEFLGKLLIEIVSKVDLCQESVFCDLIRLEIQYAKLNTITFNEPFLFNQAKASIQQSNNKKRLSKNIVFEEIVYALHDNKLNTVFDNCNMTRFLFDTTFSLKRINTFFDYDIFQQHFKNNMAKAKNKLKHFASYVPLKEGLILSYKDTKSRTYPSEKFQCFLEFAFTMPEALGDIDFSKPTTIFSAEPLQHEHSILYILMRWYSLLCSTSKWSLLRDKRIDDLANLINALVLDDGNVKKTLNCTGADTRCESTIGLITLNEYKTTLMIAFDRAENPNESIRKFLAFLGQQAKRFRKANQLFNSINSHAKSKCKFYKTNTSDFVMVDDEKKTEDLPQQDSPPTKTKRLPTASAPPQPLASQSRLPQVGAASFLVGEPDDPTSEEAQEEYQPGLATRANAAAQQPSQLSSASLAPKAVAFPSAPTRKLVTPPPDDEKLVDDKQPVVADKNNTTTNQDNTPAKQSEKPVVLHS